MNKYFKLFMNRYFKLATYFLFVPFLLYAEKPYEQTGLTLDIKNKSLREAIRIIEDASGYSFVFNSELVDNSVKTVSLTANGSGINEVMDGITAQTGIAYRVGENTVVLEKPVTTKQPSVRGSISGIVLDEAGEPVSGAIVIVLGLPSIGTATDADGKYLLPDMPAKTVAVQFSFLSYETLVVEGVKVAAGKTTPLNVVLKEATQQLGEVVVTANYNQASAAGLYAVQKLNASMTDGISSDLIKRTSDNNVAQVLKRVAGVTVQDNKYVTVRGMSERYNNVQLNGSSLPSTEPNRRNFSFDIIPSNLIENVTVNKTFTPDLPGEFTGGLVQVNTLSIPNEKFFNISVGTGGNTESTGRDFKTNKRFGADYLFGEKEERVWYAGRQPENFPQSTTNAGQMNHFGFDIYRAIPLQNHALSFGLPFKINDAHTIGLVAAATYRHEETIETLEELHQFDRDSLWRSIAPGKTYKFVTAAGAIANIGWKTRGHAITWRNLFNNRFTHTNMERCMIESYGGEAYLENYSAPTIASLKQTQIDGEHLFFGRKLILTWNADYNTANRTNPDDRFVSGVLERDNILEANVPPLYDGKYKVSWTRIGPSVPGLDKQYLMYNNLNETKKNAAINLEYKFNLLYREQKLKAGYALSSRKSDFQQQYLSAHVGQNGIGSLGGMSLQEFYNPEHFTDGWLVYKTGGFTNRMVDYYDGEQSIDALYLMGEITPLQPLRIIGGIRMENCETEVLTRVSGYEGDQYFNKVDSLLTRSKQDWLPSLTAIYAITPSLNFRAAYSENLARADFRELSPVSYWDVNGRLDIQNVKPLEQSSSRNYDLRLEWYPSPGEVVSLSAFYKDFDKPVEKVVRMYSDKQNFGLLVVNLDRAVMRGLEFNFRKSFAFIAPALENLWLSGNFALMEGLVEAENEIWKIEKRERPLQGLAPYNLNASLMYEGSRFGAAVNYTRVGRTLLYGGEFVKHDVYENPRNVLDLQLYARFFEQRLEVKLNASDVLNEEMITYRNCDYDPSNDQAVDPGVYHSRTHLGLDYNEGDFVMSRISRGINLSASLSWKF